MFVRFIILPSIHLTYTRVKLRQAQHNKKRVSYPGYSSSRCRIRVGGGISGRVIWNKLHAALAAFGSCFPFHDGVTLAALRAVIPLGELPISWDLHGSSAL